MAKLAPIAKNTATEICNYFKFPEFWFVEYAQFAFNEVRDGTHDSPKEVSEGVPLVTSKNLKQGEIDFTNTKIISTADHDEISKRSGVQKGDILFSMIGTIGNVAVVPEDINFSVKNVGLFRRNDSLLHSRFSFHWVSSYPFQKYLDDRKRGGNQKFVSLGVLRESPVPIPPLAEQKAIADKLDHLLAKVESTKARLDRIPNILKSFRQSVLAAAVSGKLTQEWREHAEVAKAESLLASLIENRNKKLVAEAEVGNQETKRLLTKIKKHRPNLPNIKLPENWLWTSFMGAMEKVVDCHNKTAPYIDQGIPLIRTPDIRNGKISLEGAKYISEETYEYWSRRCPPEPGDIIFTREAPMGEAGIISEGVKLCMGQRMMLLRPLPEFVNPKYLLLNILSLDFQQRMNDQAIGTGVKHLRVADVESLTFPLAPFQEQTEIVRRVEQLFAHADKVEQQVQQAQERVNKLTQSILAKAFRGELTEQWRLDNPDLISGENSAEALLAKIKAEREVVKPKKKLKRK